MPTAPDTTTATTVTAPRWERYGSSLDAEVRAAADAAAADARALAADVAAGEADDHEIAARLHGDVLAGIVEVLATPANVSTPTREHLRAAAGPALLELCARLQDRVAAQPAALVTVADVVATARAATACFDAAALHLV